MPDFGRSDGAESPAGPSSDILMGIGCVDVTGSAVDYDLRKGKRALYTISDGDDLMDAGSTEQLVRGGASLESCTCKL